MKQTKTQKIYQEKICTTSLKINSLGRRNVRPDRKLNLHKEIKVPRNCQNKEYFERHLNLFLFPVKDNCSKKNSINAFYVYDIFKSIVYDKYSTKDGREDMEVYFS